MPANHLSTNKVVSQCFLNFISKQKVLKPWRGPSSIAAVYDSDCYLARKPSGQKTKVHVSRIKHYDPLNHPVDPTVQPSRDTDHDVAATHEVVGANNDNNHDVPQPGQQAAEAKVANAAIPPSWVGIHFPTRRGNSLKSHRSTLFRTSSKKR